MSASSTPTQAAKSEQQQQQQKQQQAPMSGKRPSLSPMKRKRSDADESEREREAAAAASPTSLDEVAASSSKPEERVISPKKKMKAEERTSDLSKWESHLVSSITSSVNLACIAKDAAAAAQYEPIPFSWAPATPLASDELEILNHFLA